MSTPSCIRCEISLNYPANKFPINYDMKKVSSGQDNILLHKILSDKRKKFLVLHDGARYGIEILNDTKRTTLLKQYVLHYNGEKLVPVYVRMVRITKS